MATKNSKNLKAKKATIVVIDCPRCAGHGQRPEWRPDNGICYRCRGKAEVKVDVDKYRGALMVLRAKYRRLAIQVQSSNGNGSLAKDLLEMCVQDGRRVRETLDMAEAILEANKTRQTCMVFEETSKRA
jgi:hypothetical protein